MATQNDFVRAFNYPKTAISAYNRVAVGSDGRIAVADDKIRGIGVIQTDVQGASWENPDVRFWGTGSVQVLGTGGPITLGDTLYMAAGGKVSVTGTLTAGVALTALGAVSGALEIYPQFDL